MRPRGGVIARKIRYNRDFRPKIDPVRANYLAMAALIPLIVIAVIALIGVAIYFAHLREKQRTEALAAVAAQLGWSFSPDREYGYDTLHPKIGAFNRGHTRFAHNLMRGEARFEIPGSPAVHLPTVGGDYHYQITTSNGKNTQTTTYRFSFLLVRLPVGVREDLTIRPESIFDKIKAGIGFDDIDFESAEFSDRFYVQGSDKRFAYDLIHPRMMEHLMETDPLPIAISRGHLCYTKGNGRWEPEEFGRHLHWLEGFFAHWPRHLELT